VVDKLLWNEITICDFLRGLEPLILVGTRGARSRGVKVQHFRVLAYNGTVALEIVISRYPIARRGGVTWRRAPTRASGFSISEFAVTRDSRLGKSRYPKTR
jgi:hypothetical protein